MYIYYNMYISYVHGKKKLKNIININKLNY